MKVRFFACSVDLGVFLEVMQEVRNIRMRQFSDVIDSLARRRMFMKFRSLIPPMTQIIQWLHVSNHEVRKFVPFAILNIGTDGQLEDASCAARMQCESLPSKCVCLC